MFGFCSNFVTDGHVTSEKHSINELMEYFLNIFKGYKCYVSSQKSKKAN